MKVSRLLVPAALAAMLTSASVVPAFAMESSAPKQATPKQAEAIAADLGQERSAGAYYDAGTDRSYVNVTDASAADAARNAGATPRMVTRNGAKLNSVKKALDQAKVVPGSSWGVDVRSNTVTISIDKTVTGAKLARVESLAEKYGSTVKVKRLKGTLRPALSGGDQIRKYRTDGGYGWCSVGFNVIYNNNPSKHAFLSAGHCGNAGGTWTDSSATNAATVAQSSFPGNDYAIYDYVAGYTSYPSAVGGQTISSYGTPSIGTTVYRRGATTGTRSGTVEAHNQTVWYGGSDWVYGLTQTTACAEGGDSGGSFYSGSTAYGMTSGGDGDCTSGGTTFYQPVGEALSAYGVRLG